MEEKGGAWVGGVVGGSKGLAWVGEMVVWVGDRMAECGLVALMGIKRLSLGGRFEYE